MKLKDLRQTDNLPMGALLVLASSGMFALMGTAIKALSHVPVEMVVFFRNFFGLVTLIPWLLLAGKSGLRTQRFRLHLARTLSGLTAMYCFFYVLGHLHLGEAVLLNFSAPLFVPFIALWWLWEPVPGRLYWVLGGGLLGIILILKPTQSILTPVAVAGLASGVFAAVATVCVRDLSATEPPERIVFYFGALATLISGIPLPGNWQPLDWGQWGILLGIGILATAGQVLLTRGISKAPAGQVGPFSYATVLFAAVIGWAVWDEAPDNFSVIGGVMVCSAGIVALLGERPPRPMAGL